MRTPIHLPAALAFAALVVAGCAPGTRSAVPDGFAAPTIAQQQPPRGLKTPALVAVNLTTGALEYWPVDEGPSQNPSVLTKSLGVYYGYAMAANGYTVAIANYTPPEVVTYDLKTGKQATMHDDFGNPYDIAIAKDGTIYALNAASVAVYKPGSSQPTQLLCVTISQGEGIAIDNEGDVFVNGYGPRNFMGVVEYPNGSGNCITLHLRAEKGYAAGVGIDPKTDDLIVVDNPDYCAGGYEGIMLIYSKPYRPGNARRHNLNAGYCAGGFRLDADSKHIFVSDSTVSAGFPLIDQRSYPRARGGGYYSNGYSSYAGGFTTIPNTLPN